MNGIGSLVYETRVEMFLCQVIFLFKQGLAPNRSIGEVCLCMFNATCEIKGYYLVRYEIVEY